MAHRTALIRSARARLPLLVALVLLAHAVAIDWMGRQLDEAPVLRPLPPPMLTRLLQPAPPPTPVAAAPAPPPVKRSRARALPQAPVAPASAPRSPDSEAVASAPALDPPWPDPTVTAPATGPAQASPSPGAETGTTEAAAPSQFPESAALTPAAPAAPDVTAQLDSWPVDTRLNYQLSGQFRSGALYGNARVQWQRQGARYETRVEVDLTMIASIAITSQGEVAANGLVPRAYEEHRRSGRRVARLDETTITFGDGRVVPRPPGVQDAASQFVELSHRFATGRDPLEVGKSVSFWMARPGAVDLWTYDIVGREILEIPQMGAIEAFRLKPRPIANPRGNITAEMWFAPTLQYLPVRIRLNMGEEAFIDLTVEKIEQR